MDCEKYENQINDYLEDSLDETNKIQFESFLNNNQDFKQLVEDIKSNNSLLKNAPKVTSSSDFIINLNKRIDKYEESKNVLSRIFSYKYKIYDINRFALFGALSLILIVSFSLFKLSNINIKTNFSNMSNSKLNTSFAINDDDSLKNINDDTPILLLGNEK